MDAKIHVCVVTHVQNLTWKDLRSQRRAMSVNELWHKTHGIRSPNILILTYYMLLSNILLSGHGSAMASQ